MATPDVHEERQRLLLSMKQAPDYYELAFSSAEHAGYLRGLRDAGLIGGPAHDLYLAEAQHSWAAAQARFEQVA